MFSDCSAVENAKAAGSSMGHPLAPKRSHPRLSSGAIVILHAQRGRCSASLSQTLAHDRATTWAFLLEPALVGSGLDGYRGAACEFVGRRVCQSRKEGELPSGSIM